MSGSGLEDMRYPVVDDNLCVGCGACATACPRNAIRVEEKAQVDYERCNSCGMCIQACPRNAIRLLSSGNLETDAARPLDSKKLQDLRQKMKKLSDDLNDIKEEIEKL